MAKHLSPTERDEARRLAGQRMPVIDIWRKLTAARGGRRQAPPDLTTIRRFLKAQTHRQDAPETRGRKHTLSRRTVMTLNKTRKTLIAKAGGQHEVHWEDVRKKARAPKVHTSTIARAFAREGLHVRWRAPREKPMRGPEHESER